MQEPSANTAVTSDLVQLSFFADIGKAIVSARTIREILDKVMEQVGSIFAPMNWSILLVDPKTDELVFKLVVGEAAEKLQGLRISTDYGISGWIYRTGQAAVIKDVTKDPRFSDRIDRMTHFSTKSIIGVPLKSSGRVLGIIELINKLNGKPFTPYDLKVLSTIADFTAIAIEKAFYVTALARLSRMDYLTNVLNRRSFDSILRRETERCRKDHSKLSVLLIDIDKFKEINDTVGHITGDRVLQECARIIRDNVRAVDFTARFGGDEFGVIMPNTEAEEAERAKQRILDAVENSANPEIPRFSVSIGRYTADEGCDLDILERTDSELYRAKFRRERIRVEDYLLEFIDSDEEDEND